MLIFSESRGKVLVTGGAGFIGGALVRYLLMNTMMEIYVVDKMGYSSDLHSVRKTISYLGSKAENRMTFYQVDISNKNDIDNAIKLSSPDIVFHLAAESHVDKAIMKPQNFLESNVIGTFNLLQSLLIYWEKLPQIRKSNFRFIHISTDEVFGSLGDMDFFTEETPYNPRNPYAASKAASDHFVKSWFYTYNFPIIITNSSNNFGPWQFPEKLIPMVITNASSNRNIPVYGDGENIRDWLYVEDHIEALINVCNKGQPGESYCISSENERSNKQIIELICNILDKERPRFAPHFKLINYIEDRPGHDRRYAIKPLKILDKLGWQSRYDFELYLTKTIFWYLNNTNWVKSVIMKSKKDV